MTYVDVFFLDASTTYTDTSATRTVRNIMKSELPLLLTFQPGDSRRRFTVNRMPCLAALHTVISQHIRSLGMVSGTRN